MDANGIGVHGGEAVNSYRVKVNSFVVVRARDQKDALARAELALRQAVTASYESDDRKIADQWADGWHLFGFQATGKPERIEEDGE